MLSYYFDFHLVFVPNKDPANCTMSHPLSWTSLHYPSAISSNISHVGGDGCDSMDGGLMDVAWRRRGVMQSGTSMAIWVRG